MMALNIPTYVNLYGYGYRNVYELDELVKVNDRRIAFERSIVEQEPSNPAQLVAQTTTPIYVREVAQLPQPWIKTDSGAEHMRPEYAAKDPVKISLVDRSFDIHSRKAGHTIRLTVRHESKTTLDLSIALDAEIERLKGVHVLEPLIRSENHVEKSVKKNIWTPVFRDDGYAGSTWELWWGDEPLGK